MSKKYKIFLFSPIVLPIPAIGGGAIETLLTSLIDQNEIEQRVEFVLISKYDKQLENVSYNHTKIYFFDDYDIHNNKEYFHNLYKKYCFYKKIKKKILKNRITKRLYKKPIKILSPFLFQCYQIAKKEKVDIVINEGNWDAKDCLCFCDLVGVENVYYHLHYNRKELIDFRSIIPNSISISKFVRNEWANNKSIEGKNHVLYNGIDLSKFKIEISKVERDDKRKELGINSDDILVLFCGRFIPEKGIKQLLEAFELIDDNKIKLLVIGNLGFSDNNHSEFSRFVIDKAKDMRNVQLLGYIPNDELPYYYKIADMQIVPSIWQEGAGLVAIEGMASGLPLVITKSGGMIEYVNEDASIQVPINDDLPKNLAKNIVYLSKNEELRKKMSKAGEERAECFSSKMFYDRFIDLFEV